MSGHGETVTGPQRQPIIHKPVPLRSRVKLPDSYHKLDHSVWGYVQGIASVHLMWTYIVVLDEPLDTEYGSVHAVAVPGSELEGEGGKNWRFGDEDLDHIEQLMANAKTNY